jgi:MoxR-like ATPase
MRSISGQSGAAFGPVCLAGAPGLGKSAVAKAIHTELANLDIIETNGETLNSKQELLLTLIRAGAKTTLFIDEAQALGPPAQHVLLTALSEGILRAPVRSRAVFHQLIKAGAFPPPVYCILTKRPMYPWSLQRRCLRIRSTGIGFDGRPTRFNMRRKTQQAGSRARKPACTKTWRKSWKPWVFV